MSDMSALYAGRRFRLNYMESPYRSIHAETQRAAGTDVVLEWLSYGRAVQDEDLNLKVARARPLANKP
jgi:hypothetical protein